MSRIIIIGPAYPLRGGLATFNERLARQYSDMGNEVIIYTFSLQYPGFLFPGKTQYSQSQPPEDISIKVAINSVNPLNWWKTGREISRLEPDLVIIRFWLPFMGPCLGTLARIIRKNKKSKIVALVDNALPHEKRPGDRLFTGYFVQSVHGFVTMSQYVREDLRQFTNKDVFLARHPLYDNFGKKLPKEEARKILGLPEDKYIYLFFGFIRTYKGLDLLVDAFHGSPDDSILLIAGEFYAGEDEIKHQIEHTPVRDRIVAHTHFINDEEVSLYFSAADCVVQPYRNATQSGVTPLAYHFEVPMIVTNVGALPDLVPEQLGVVCEPDTKSLASALFKIREMDKQTFQTAIRTAKAELSWEKLVDSICQASKSC